MHGGNQQLSTTRRRPVLPRRRRGRFCARSCLLPLELVQAVRARFTICDLLHRDGRVWSFLGLARGIDRMFSTDFGDQT